MSIQSCFFELLFTLLFGCHVLLGIFDQKVPWLWVSRLMFWFGERAGRGKGQRFSVEELTVKDANLKKRRDPFVIRTFLEHTLSIEELVESIGPQSPVQTHSYGDLGGIVDEMITLTDLVKRIQLGRSTNAKAATFPREALHSLLEDLEDRVDTIRGTTGLPRSDLAQQFFVGGTDTFTRCHADPSLNCYLQLSGVKRWRLAPPSCAGGLYVLPRGRNISYISTVLKVEEGDIRYHSYERTDWYVTDLHPGDLLVIPPFWFHEVQNRPSPNGNQKEVVVGLAMNWLSPKHAWRQAPLMAAGSLLRPRLWQRHIFPMACSVDDDIMTACRQVCGCQDANGLERDKKVA